MNVPVRIFGVVFLALAHGVGTVVAAGPQDQVATNVALFDELVACAKHPDFESFGIAQPGPCGDWVDRVERAQESDLLLLKSGYQCLAGDIRIAGNSMTSSDMEHVGYVKSLVDECRE